MIIKIITIMDMMIMLINENDNDNKKIYLYNTICILRFRKDITIQKIYRKYIHIYKG